MPLPPSLLDGRALPTHVYAVEYVFRDEARNALLLVMHGYVTNAIVDAARRLSSPIRVGAVENGLAGLGDFRLGNPHTNLLFR
jgi:hypothetical protein